MTTRRTSPLLAGPDGRALLAGSILARLPLAMLSIAILVHTQELTGSFAVAGLACSAYAICGAVASPVLGRMVDRRGQTHVLVAGAVLSAATLIVTGLLGADSPPALLVALAGAAGLATPPLAACVRTLLPAIVSGPSELPALFALESTLLEVTFVLGPPLALALGAVWSTGAALVVSGLMMVAGTAVFAAHHASRAWRPDVDAARSRAGSLSSAAIRVLVIVDLGTGVVFGATEVGVTATATHVAGAAAAAPLLGLWGAGSLIGGVVVTRLGARFRTATHLPVLLGALALTHGALLAGTGSLPVMGLIILLAGATIAPTGASIYAMVDRFAPAGTRTEAFSWLFTSSSSGAAAGAALAGVLVQNLGADMAFACAGIAGAVAMLVAILGARHLAPRAETYFVVTAASCIAAVRALVERPRPSTSASISGSCSGTRVSGSRSPSGAVRRGFSQASRATQRGT
jgi:MFS family permease